MKSLDARVWKKDLARLSDESLLQRTHECARSEREQTAWLVAHLAEVYRRDLALQRGYPSLVQYARTELKLTEAMAWDRGRAAQLALELPEVVERLASGELSLSSVGELWRTFQASKATTSPKPEAALQPAFSMASAPDRMEPAPITKTEKKELLQAVLGKSRRESEAVIREWKQERTGAEVSPRPRPSSARKTHSKEWTELALYLGPEELAKLDRLRDLLSHRLGTCDPHTVMSWLLEMGLEKVDPLRQEARATRRRAKSEDQLAIAGTEENQASAEEARIPAAPRCLLNSAERKMKIVVRKPIPSALKRRIWTRDQGICQYKDEKTGWLCASTAFLDLDHIQEVRNGGPSTEQNLRLVCRSHNRRRHLWE